VISAVRQLSLDAWRLPRACGGDLKH